MPRAQIPLPVLEAAIGVLLLTAVGLLVMTAGPTGADHSTQLDAYAQDAGQLLRSAPPRHANETRLGEVAASPGAFERERDALDRRMRRLLPTNLLYQLRTPQGTVGDRFPGDVSTGSATFPTAHGPVTVRVWYG